jgi:hypothetical protein
MKRMRKAGVTDPVSGELIPRPYMPRVADLPSSWRHFTTAQKDRPPDRPRSLLQGHVVGPIAELDPLRASYGWQVWRVLFMIGVRAMRDGTLEREIARERDRERRLEALARRFAGEHRTHSCRINTRAASRGKSGRAGGGCKKTRRGCKKTRVGLRRNTPRTQRNLVFPLPLSEPNRAIGADRYSGGTANRRRYEELAGFSGCRDPADFHPGVLGEPQCAIGASRYTHGLASRLW